MGSPKTVITRVPKVSVTRPPSSRTLIEVPTASHKEKIKGSILPTSSSTKVLPVSPKGQTKERTIFHISNIAAVPKTFRSPSFIPSGIHDSQKDKAIKKAKGKKVLKEEQFTSSEDIAKFINAISSKNYAQI